MNEAIHILLRVAGYSLLALTVFGGGVFAGALYAVTRGAA